MPTETTKQTETLITDWRVPPLKTVHDHRLSLWQSSARAAAHEQILCSLAPVSAGTLYNHPLVRAATEHARLGSIKSTDLPEPGTMAFARLEPEQRLRTLAVGSTTDPDPVYLSSLFFEHANATLQNDTTRVASLEIEIRKYSTDDIAGWITCVENYAYYLAKTSGRLTVNLAQVKLADDVDRESGEMLW